MAKQITPSAPNPVSAFHFAANSLQDVFELMVFAPNCGYQFQLNSMPNGTLFPTMTGRLIPIGGVTARSTKPVVTIRNTEWVIWQNDTFSVFPDSYINDSFNIEDAPAPTPPDFTPEPSPPVQEGNRKHRAT